jgi:hypothetical protein
MDQPALLNVFHSAIAAPFTIALAAQAERLIKLFMISSVRWAGRRDCSFEVPDPSWRGEPLASGIGVCCIWPQIPVYSGTEEQEQTPWSLIIIAVPTPPSDGSRS